MSEHGTTKGPIFLNAASFNFVEPYTTELQAVFCTLI
jgi:hypothetical protein